MSDVIKLLPDHVANQIAAGEVVQRPASVVKELLENAIDAKASLIKLIIKDAGKTLIQVIDNGIGMSTTDARLSFERHATSKITTAEDLFQLHTKGFRGEALASIAAIAHVEMNTKQDTDEVGTQLIIEGSKVVAQDVTVTPTGTSIAVKNLFFNIPARRNFLKSNQVELRHVIDEFHRVALTHPDVHFEMYQNGAELFSLPPSNQRKRIVNIFGKKTNEKLVPVEEETDVVKISGFVYKPSYAKKSRGEQFFFANQRYIKSSYLHHAVVAAFDGLINAQMYPGYFLFLEVKPETIDINIHPTKTEVKFDDEHSIYAILKSAVKHSLGQFSVAPVLDFERDKNLDTPYTYQQKLVQVPTIEVDASFNPFENDASATTKYKASAFKKEKAANWESLYVDTNTTDFSSIEVESEEVVGSLFTDNAVEEKKSVTYQLQKKYIVTTIKSGLVVINQNRAHQRVLYEQFLKSTTGANTVSQQLLFPLQLHFSTKDVVAIKQAKEALEHVGFLFDECDAENVVLSGIPMHVNETQVKEILDNVAATIQQEVPGNSFSLTDEMAKIMAQSVAVKTGEALTTQAQEGLVNNLFACKEPLVSPDNKPTFITLTTNDLDKRF
jgi:DNA mismatch repair protein MutL